MLQVVSVVASTPLVEMGDEEEGCVRGAALSGVRDPPPLLHDYETRQLCHASSFFITFKPTIEW